MLVFNVSCTLRDTSPRPGPTSRALLTVPVEDTLITVQEFCRDLATHVQSLVQSALRVEVLQLSWQGTICKPEDELDMYMAVAPGASFAAIALLVPKEDDELPLQLKVARHGAEPLLVEVPSKYATVRQLKQVLLEKTKAASGSLAHPLRLVFKDKSMDQDGWLLSDYGITDGASLSIADGPTKGIGSSRFFADVSKVEDMSSISFSDSAPDWRLARRGLNIEGYCRNSSCHAANKLVIDSSHAMGSFDLIINGDECKCPQCGHVLLELETCGFWGCQWKYSGLQKTEQGPKKVMQKEWVTASEDKYDRFEEASKGTGVTWARLVVQTRVPPGKNNEARECGICYEALAVCDRQVMSCGHLFHASCLAPWLNRSSTCPTCRVQIEEKPVAATVEEAVVALKKG